MLLRPIEFTQYTALSFGQRPEEVGIVPPVRGVGSAYDNALAKSFVATLKTELLYQNHWPTRHNASTSRASTTLEGGTLRSGTLARRSMRRSDYEKRPLCEKNVSTVTGQVHFNDLQEFTKCIN